MSICRPSRSALALAAVSVVLFAASSAARAEARLLDDREMRSVYGRADVSLPVLPGAGGLPGVGGSSDGSDPGSRLTAALMKGAKVSMLDQAAFLAAWHDASGTDSRPPSYDGRAVMQIQITADPVSMSFDGNELFSALAGGTPYHGPSMGTFTLNNVDARGTTLWVWGH